MGDNANWAGVIEQARLDILYIADARVEIPRMGFATALKNEENENLIANGDFESTSAEDLHLPEDWRVSATTDGSFELTATQDGGAAARLSLRKPDAKMVVQQHVDYDDMGRYEIVLDYKASGLDRGELAMVLHFADIFGESTANRDAVQPADAGVNRVADIQNVLPAPKRSGERRGGTARNIAIRSRRGPAR